MSKYVLNKTLRMNPCFILIIVLEFATLLVYCSDKGGSIESNSFSRFPESQIRYKREQKSYMQWRGNLEPSSEFILKIPDDEDEGPVSKGLNIISGVKIPSTVRPTLTTTIEDYTRFGPPEAGLVTSIKDVFLAPVPLVDDTKQVEPAISDEIIDHEPTFAPRNFAPIKNPNRDESPPASPQFLPRRTSTLPSRQYAPVNSVAFSPYSTHSPKSHQYQFDNSRRLMTSTETDPDVITPSRTTEEISEDLADFVLQMVDETRSESESITETMKIFNVPQRTTLDPDNEFDEDLQNIETTDIGPSKERKESHEPTLRTAVNTELVESDVIQSISSNKAVKFEDGNDYKYTDDYNYDSKEKDKKIGTEIETNRQIDAETSNDEYNDAIALYKNETKNMLTEQFYDYGLLNLSKPWRETDKQLCSLLKLRPLGFNSPRTLKEIVTQLKHWVEKSPLVKWTDITDGNLTTMENPIHMMIVDDPSSGQIVTAKQTVMIVAGILGRDHHAVAAAMYVLYQLLDRSDAHADILSRYRFWVVPVFNPDGYDYSLTFPHRKGWTKNLHQTWEVCRGKETEMCNACQSSRVGCIIQPCFGTNLDRNFEYQWIPANELHADQKCGDLFPGSRQLSEAETRALTRFMHRQRVPLYMFVAFKEGDVLGVMYPYSHTRKRRAYDHLYRQRAIKAANAANSISGRSYVAGQSSEFLSLYAGGIEDWVDGHLGVDNTFTVMMFRTGDRDDSKLVMERVVHEAYAALDTLLLHTTVDPPPLPAITSLKHAQPLRISSQPALRYSLLRTLATVLAMLLLR